MLNLVAPGAMPNNASFYGTTNYIPYNPLLSPLHVNATTCPALHANFTVIITNPGSKEQEKLAQQVTEQINYFLSLGLEVSYYIRMVLTYLSGFKIYITNFEPIYENEKESPPAVYLAVTRTLILLPEADFRKYDLRFVLIYNFYKAFLHLHSIVKYGRQISAWVIDPTDTTTQEKYKEALKKDLGRLANLERTAIRIQKEGPVKIPGIGTAKPDKDFLALQKDLRTRENQVKTLTCKIVLKGKFFVGQNLTLPEHRSGPLPGNIRVLDVIAEKNGPPGVSTIIFRYYDPILAVLAVARDIENALNKFSVDYPQADIVAERYLYIAAYTSDLFKDTIYPNFTKFMNEVLFKENRFFSPVSVQGYNYSSAIDYYLLNFYETEATIALREVITLYPVPQIFLMLESLIDEQEATEATLNKVIYALNQIQPRIPSDLKAEATRLRGRAHARICQTRGFVTRLFCWNTEEHAQASCTAFLKAYKDGANFSIEDYLTCLSQMKATNNYHYKTMRQKAIREYEDKISQESSKSSSGSQRLVGYYAWCIEQILTQFPEKYIGSS